MKQEETEVPDEEKEGRNEGRKGTDWGVALVHFSCWTRQDREKERMSQE